MRVALDSNVMIYAEGVSDAHRRHLALEIVDAIHATELLIPLQAVGELRRWLAGKGGLAKSEAVERSNRWIAEYPTQDTDQDVFLAAGELMIGHNLQAWDSIILAAAWAGGASVLLSEDMQDGFKWRGITVANPFLERPTQLVKDILSKTKK
jgi:predicted nucleic acid-binding protein